MAGRRAPGEGSLCQRGENGPWVARFKGLDGRYTSRTSKRKTDCLSWLRQKMVEKEQGHVASAGRQTLGQYLDWWLSDVMRPPRVQDRTHFVYHARVDHVTRLLGHIRLDAIRPEHAHFLHRELERTMGNRSIAAIHGTLKAALTTAVEYRYLAWNPIAPVKPPSFSIPEQSRLTAGQARRLLEATQDTRWHALLFLLIQCGLRIGEATALLWDDLPDDALTVHIERTLQQVPHGGYTFGPPKTARSRRPVFLSPPLRVALDEHKRLQRLERMATLGWGDHGLIFPNAHGGPMGANLVGKELRGTLARLGLPRVTVHGLRHTCGSLMRELEADPKLLQEGMGHARMQLTYDVYLHTQEDEHRAMAARLGALLEGAS